MERKGMRKADVLQDELEEEAGGKRKYESRYKHGGPRRTRRKK
jgi:hypothetical protein